MSGGLLVGDEAPKFEANTTIGPIHFHNYLGDTWMVRSPQKCYFFPSLMKRIRTWPLCRHDESSRERGTGHACDSMCGVYFWS
uniref:Uncharacterized protein n=1 Tax=Equus asinus TaxID=9793 RepID=A0A8C4PI95_EQUAS